MPPLPLPNPDPSEASERSSLLPTSLLSPLRKADIVDTVSSMNMEQPDASWNLCLAPAKKNSKAELEEELEMREGMGLKLGAESPCLEFGGGIGTGVA